MATDPGKVELTVLRYRPEQDEAPWWQTYEVPYADDLSVLQALQFVQDELDPTLVFRWSCRMAVCGSCGMMIDGRPRLACRTFLRDFPERRLRVEPLAHFPIDRDLVAVIDDFPEKLRSIRPGLEPAEARTIAQGEHLQTPLQQQDYLQFADCINCLLCYAACAQYGLDPSFLGPAATALMHRWNADSRDGGRELRMERAHRDDGVWPCTAVGYCSEVCPKGVDPAHAINQTKTASAVDFFARFLRSNGDAARKGEGPGR
jgi:fumarate reductase iron-sulfur subunit